MKAKSIIVFSLLLVAVVYAQDGRPPMKVGDPAPTLHLEALLQAPGSTKATWDALKGNVVVLEFWATWCGPCRAALPHLNELAGQYKNKPVRFISITYEEEWKVKSYLSVNSIAGWIGIDHENSLFKAFGFSGIPQTVLVDRNGRVAALLQPSQLTNVVLDQLLAGKAVSILAPGLVEAAVAAPETLPKAQDQALPSLLEIAIRPAKPSASMSWNRGMLKAKGMALNKLVSHVYSISQARMVAVGPVPEEAYEVTARILDERKEQFLPMLQQAMAAAFGLKTWREKREMDVLVLRVPAGHQAMLRSSGKTNGNWTTDDGAISGSAMTIEDFRMSLEGELLRVVLDETGLKGAYDISLYWNPRDEESIFREIGKQLGLELKKERRSIEVLCFEIPKLSLSR